MALPLRKTAPIPGNTKVIDIYKELGEYGITPIVVDPAADAEEAKRLYGITFDSMDAVKNMDAVIVAVSHEQFLGLNKEMISGFYNPAHEKKVFMDIKGLFDRNEYLTEDYIYWRL